MTVKPRCFVAMAFDQSDTDALYEKSIKPVLRASGVTPVIINRRQDNRDINHQIIEQLNACDFAIADLTYARPSVYFEAGYAQRKVDVIYSVRADHLKRNQADDRRVHFDLWMKPLLKWHSPDDAKFRESLRKRLRNTVLRGWKRRAQEEEKEKQDVADFQCTPLEERLERLRREVLSKLDKFGHTDWRVLAGLRGSRVDFALRDYTQKEILENLRRLPRLFSFFMRGRTCSAVSVWVVDSLTLRILRDEFGHRFLASSYPPHLSKYSFSDDQPRTSIEHHILCSLKPVPRSRIMSALPTVQWDENTRCYAREIPRQRGAADQKSLEQVPLTRRVINVHVVDDIRSFRQFSAEISRIAQVMTHNRERD